MALSLRLKTIASFVSPYQHIVDIGTDHCLLPIYLISTQRIEQAIATDVKTGPHEEAKKNIIKYHLEHSIDLRLGNGLSPLKDEDNLDVVIISGMGGHTIVDILDKGKTRLKKNSRLILQPNIDEDVLRRFLCENHYEIVEEVLVKEDKFYEIIVAERRDKLVSLTKEELRFGPIFLKKRPPLFYEKWQVIYSKKAADFAEIPVNVPKKAVYEEELVGILTILNQK